ncbi:diguanylate cyclase domain-containing protein [Tychonema sp. BBK16]|uniref:diguanylate cyclase domain-containing protein n=1 Tax=Tychonema sp. BBK16 TaxID=2699888 RepID=UPI001F4885CC|nr:diguanylate cyclase [Tychonema sp. BBK16]MCF6371948.1 diguanylate cyclase [Tychonema sp. BBK16]
MRVGASKLCASYQGKKQAMNIDKQIQDQKDSKKPDRADRSGNINITKEIDSSLQECLDFKGAIDRSALAVRTNGKGIINYVSDRVCEISKYSRIEILGSHFGILHWEYQSSELIRNLQSTLKKGEIWQGEIKTLAKDGADYWVHAVIVPFLDCKGKPYQYLALGFDITERKAIAVVQAEANRAKDEFLAIASHELRSPLSAILGWVQLARSRKLNEATTSLALEIIERNAKLQNQQIDNLLDLSRLLRGKMKLNIGQVHLPSVIESAIDILRPAADAKNIDIITNFDPAISHILGDAERLQQVVWNLLSNAIKFTPTSTSALIEITIESASSSALIVVSDGGCGIEPKFMPYIFDYFRSTDSWNTKEQNRLGLGLFIVRQLVEMHGGTVWASSLGIAQGTTFGVQLPIANHQDVPDDRNSAIGQMENRAESIRQALAQKQVLVVDDSAGSKNSPNWVEDELVDDSRDLPLLLVVEDNYFLLVYLETLLTPHYRVAVARDGIEGLEQAKKLLPNLILSDQIMPRQNGLDLLKEIRNTPELSSTPVIFLTARTGMESRIESLDAGADDYISKPFDERELLARVRNLLRSHAAEQQLVVLNRQLQQQKQQLETVNQALQYLATYDSLTEVKNRRCFNEYLDTEWRRLAREEAPLSLIMCDIDYFKLYNDTYGHQAGDECLRKVASVLRSAVKRPADLVARYGGEEFAVVLPNTDIEGATVVAEFIRAEVLGLQIVHAKSVVCEYVTLSLGVACCIPMPMSLPGTLIAIADQALYHSKQTGRDRVSTAIFKGY